MITSISGVLMGQFWMPGALMETKVGHTPACLVVNCMALLQSCCWHTESLKNTLWQTLPYFPSVSRNTDSRSMLAFGWKSVHQQVCSRFYIHSNVLVPQIFRFHLLPLSCSKGVQRADLPLALLLLYSSQLYSLFRTEISAQILKLGTFS